LNLLAKKKICDGCQIENFIWKTVAGKKYCLPCSQRLFPYKQKTQVKKFISPISEGRAKSLKKYRVVRDQYLKDHPICEFPGCQDMKVELHHKCGRVGELLTNSNYFCSLCNSHHKFCELNPLEAQRLGLSKKRL
jgi:hypothetical protein